MSGKVKMSFSKATESLALECRVTHSLLGLAFCCLTLRLFSIVGCQGASHTLFPSTCQSPQWSHFGLWSSELHGRGSSTAFLERFLKQVQAGDVHPGQCNCFEVSLCQCILLFPSLYFICWELASDDREELTLLHCSNSPSDKIEAN